MFEYSHNINRTLATKRPISTSDFAFENKKSASPMRPNCVSHASELRPYCVRTASALHLYCVHLRQNQSLYASLRLRLRLRLRPCVELP